MLCEKSSVEDEKPWAGEKYLHYFLKRIFSLITLSWNSFCQKWISIKCIDLFLTFISLPFIQMSVIMPSLHCFDYCSFVLSFDKCESANLIVLTILSLLYFLMNFRISLSIPANIIAEYILLFHFYQWFLRNHNFWCTSLYVPYLAVNWGSWVNGASLVAQIVKNLPTMQ